MHSAVPSRPGEAGASRWTCLDKSMENVGVVYAVSFPDSPIIKIGMSMWKNMRVRWNALQQNLQNQPKLHFVLLTEEMPGQFRLLFTASCTTSKTRRASSSSLPVLCQLQDPRGTMATKTYHARILSDDFEPFVRTLLTMTDAQLRISSTNIGWRGKTPVRPCRTTLSRPRRLHLPMLTRH